MFSSRSLCELTATELRDTAVHRQRQTTPAGSSTHEQHHHFQNHSKIGGKSIILGGYKFGERIIGSLRPRATQLYTLTHKYYTRALTPTIPPGG